MSEEAPSRALHNLIAGKWVSSPSNESMDVHDPATGEVLARVPLSGGTEVDEAVRGAADAAEAWRDVPVPERARLMFELHRLILDRFEELAELVVRENGKGIEEARGELRRGLEVVEFAAGAPTLLAGSVVEQVSRQIDEAVHRYPIGVVVGITPFNFPAMIPLWMAPLAVACGNAFILKPSPRTPLAGARLAELFAEAGLPPGVLSVVHGAADTVGHLIDHPGVQAISFVGSAAVARQVYARAAGAGKRVQALAGAKNHVVVMPDADLDFASKALFSSGFSNAGQRCLAGSVGVPVGSIADDLAGALSGLASSAKLGPGLDPESVITPLTSEDHRRSVKSWVAKGVEEGAELLVDGRGGGAERSGYFLGPSIFDRVRPHMTIAREEIFGPVLVLERADDLDDAIEIVNESRYGNAAAIFTASGWAAREFGRRVRAGMVGVNVAVPAPMAFFPFAGWKGSFYGDLHATGRDAIEFYTQRKVVTARWPGPNARGTM